MKTQTKTSLLLLSAFLVIVMIFSGFVYFSVANYSYKDFYKLLEIRAFTTARVELHRGFDTEVTEINALHNEFFDKLPQEHDYFFPLTPAKT
ncbi:MAG: two-component sensor histidine kinase, partial [Runella zeae]